MKPTTEKWINLGIIINLVLCFLFTVVLFFKIYFGSYFGFELFFYIIFLGPYLLKWTYSFTESYLKENSQTISRVNNFGRTYDFETLAVSMVWVFITFAVAICALGFFLLYLGSS